MSNTPPLSVILTIFNMGSCLEECLLSIQNQTFENYELICIDDGSTDNSSEILSRLSKSDDRIRVITQDNCGVSASRNRGIAEASGTYTMILDADDLFEETLFECMISQAQTTQADVVVCRSCEYDNQTKQETSIDWTIRERFLPGKEVFSPLELKGCVFTAFMGWPWDKIYLTQFIQEEKLSFPLIENSEDLVFVYLALVKSRRISIVDQVLIKHRVNREASLSNSRERFPRCFYESLVILKKELQKDRDVWIDFKWGFLNWALHHTCCNIHTLPEGSARSSLVTELFEGSLCELELDQHPFEYYSLYEDIPYLYEVLQAEYRNEPYRRGFWDRAASASKRINSEGFLGAFKSYFND